MEIASSEITCINMTSIDISLECVFAHSTSVEETRSLLKCTERDVQRFFKSILSFFSSLNIIAEMYPDIQTTKLDSDRKYYYR